MNPPTEKQIQDKLFNEVLPKTYPDSVVVKNWAGWSYRGKSNKKQQTKFHSEFDIALFRRIDQGGSYQLSLTGFEIKGFGGKSQRPPRFGERGSPPTR